MKRKEFLTKLKNNQGKDLRIEIEGKRIQKAILKKIKYEIKEDNLYIQSSTNSDLVEINLNTIRNIEVNQKSITVLIDDKSETKIKLTLYEKK